MGTTKSIQKKTNIKIRTEAGKIESRKATENINETEPIILKDQQELTEPLARLTKTKKKILKSEKERLHLSSIDINIIENTMNNEMELK